MKKVLGLVSVVALPILLGGQATTPHSYVPPKGFVPDSLTAVRIAVAIWTPIYGERQIASEKPYRAVLRRDTWTVTGFLPPNHPGGVAIAEISKRDGRIIRVSHGL